MAWETAIRPVGTRVASKFGLELPWASSPPEAWVFCCWSTSIIIRPMAAAVSAPSIVSRLWLDSSEIALRKPFFMGHQPPPLRRLVAA
ncbi:MAG: hypothetical protein EBU30_02390 [Synechococcaceae bacterium WB6_3B_236]|nr:hypothetical protein [Synechococcaceae bacterium WB6_3B_236]